MAGREKAVTVHGPRATIVLEGPVSAQLIAGVRRAALAGDPLNDFLETVSAAGVRKLPGFIYIGTESGSVRLLARGGLRATVLQKDGSTAEVDAAGVSTWSESVFEAVAEITVEHPGGRVVIVMAAAKRAPVVTAPAEPATTPPVVIEEVARAEETLTAAEEPIFAVEEPIPAVEEPILAADDTSGPDEFDLANLFETKYKGVEAAAVRDESGDAAPVGYTVEPPAPAYTPPPVVASPPPAVAPPSGLIASVPSLSHDAPPPPSDPGDHDGLTISVQDLARARAQQTPSAPAPISGSSVPAVLCQSGHLNPPHAAKCRTCGNDITDRTITTVSRPLLGRLYFDAGMVVDVDRPLLIGRKPAADVNVPGSELPGLVTVPDPDSSLSRVHAELRIEGWEVLVVDRESKNGTFVELPGEAPVMLRPSAPFLIVAGARISFADVAACTYRVGP